METRSLGDDNEIVQLSAVTENSSYNRYVVPETPILFHASKLTGLTVVGKSLMLKGAPVPTVFIYDCLSDFILWAQTFEKPVILYGHSVKFDVKALVRAYRKVDLVEKLKTAVVGFSDTVPIFKTILPYPSPEKTTTGVVTMVQPWLPQ